MADGKGYPLKVIVTAIDKLTAPIEKMNAKLKALNQPFREINNAAARLGQAAHLPELGEKLRTIGERAGEVGRRFGELFTKIAAVGGIGVGFGLVEIIRGTAEAGDAAIKSAEKAGISTEAWQEYAYAAKQADVSNEALQKGFKFLDAAIITARRKGGDERDIFRAFHIGVDELRKKNPGEIFEKLATGISKLKPGALKNRLAGLLFGGRSGEELIPLLDKGQAGIAQLVKRAHELGIVMSDEDAKKAEEFNDATKDLNTSLLGMRNTIGLAVIPILRPLVDWTTQWVIANKGLIATKIQDFFLQVRDALPQMRAEMVSAWHKSKPLRDIFGSIADKIGIVNLALLAAGGITFGPLIGALAGLGVALLSFGAAFSTSGLALLLAPLAAGAAIFGLIGAMDKVSPNYNPRAGKYGDAPRPRQLIHDRNELLSDGLHYGARRYSQSVSSANAFPQGRGSRPQSGTLDINVNVKAPTGTQVQTKSSGNAPRPSVGRLMPAVSP